MSELDDLLARARVALSKGDKRGAVALINHILRQDLPHQDAWQLLYQLSGAEEPLEKFQTEFAKKYYPDKAHLLVGGISSPHALPSEPPAVSEEPSLSEAERISDTKSTVESARLAVGGGLAALFIIYVVSLIITIVPLAGEGAEPKSINKGEGPYTPPAVLLPEERQYTPLATASSQTLEEAQVVAVLDAYHRAHSKMDAEEASWYLLPHHMAAIYYREDSYVGYWLHSFVTADELAEAIQRSVEKRGRIIAWEVSDISWMYQSQEGGGYYRVFADVWRTYEDGYIALYEFLLVKPGDKYLIVGLREGEY